MKWGKNLLEDSFMKLLSLMRLSFLSFDLIQNASRISILKNSDVKNAPSLSPLIQMSLPANPVAIPFYLQWASIDIRNERLSEWERRGNRDGAEKEIGMTIAGKRKERTEQ